MSNIPECDDELDLFLLCVIYYSILRLQDLVASWTDDSARRTYII